jgi:hypothetical protein
MPHTAAAVAVTTVTDGGSSSFQGMFWIGFVLQYLGSDAIETMSLMIRTMQIVLHMPAMSLKVPANVMMMYSGMMPIVCWDMLDGMVSIEMLGFKQTDEEEAPFPGQLEELGYESSNFISNTQTISFILMLLTLYCFTLGAIKIFSSCFSCCENSWISSASENLRKRLFYADWLTLTRESYMEFFIAGIIAWKHPYYHYYGDYLSLFYSAVALFLALVFLPYCISIISDKRYTALLSADYKDKYGALYKGLRLRHRKSASYLKSLTIRRLIFCILVMFMRNTDVTGLQWVLIIIFATLLPAINNMSIRVNHARW